MESNQTNGQQLNQNEPMKVCKKCRSQIPKKAKRCPHCRANQGIGFIGGLGIFILVLIIFGAIGSQSADKQAASPQTDVGAASSSSTESAPPAETPKVADLELVSHSVKQGDYYSTIVGEVKNNTDKTYSYVQVSINLYDKNDSQVGSTLANVNNLEPGKTWNFEAPVMEQNVASYKIVEVTGF